MYSRSRPESSIVLLLGPVYSHVNARDVCTKRPTCFLFAHARTRNETFFGFRCLFFFSLWFRTKSHIAPTLPGSCLSTFFVLFLVLLLFFFSRTIHACSIFSDGSFCLVYLLLSTRCSAIMALGINLVYIQSMK